MKDKLKYSFDDEPVSKFCYTPDTKRIEVHFRGYYDLTRDAYIDSPCIWLIENWEYAKSIVGDEQKRYDLNKHIGIFSIILYMKYNDDRELEIHLLTVDNRYLTLFFKDPKLTLG